MSLPDVTRYSGWPNISVLSKYSAHREAGRGSRRPPQLVGTFPSIWKPLVECIFVTEQLSLVFETVYIPPLIPPQSFRTGSRSTCQHVPIPKINCRLYRRRSLDTSGCIPGCRCSCWIQHVGANIRTTVDMTLSELLFLLAQVWV